MGPELAVCFRNGAGTRKEMRSVPNSETSSEINKIGHWESVKKMKEMQQQRDA